MLLRLCIAICLYFVVSAGMAHAQTVSLRPRIEASGSAVTMGDVFEGVPSNIAGRALAPAPQPGQIGSLQMSVLAARGMRVPESLAVEGTRGSSRDAGQNG